MPKLAFIALLLPLLLAPLGSVLAQETASSTPAVNPAFELPKTPLDDAINKWFGDGKLQEAAQEAMKKAQSELQNVAGQAVDTAKDAAQAEIERQADLTIQGAREKAEGYVGGVVSIVKNAINDFISKIKSFFSDLFAKEASTY